MHDFTPVSALFGGLLIGAAAALMLWLLGRIAGISGIAGGLLSPARGEVAWRALFLSGLLLAPLFYMFVSGTRLEVSATTSSRALIVAGLLVGFGTRLGSGCTSGHGVCGIARRSRRSIVATGTFMASAIFIVFVLRHLGGAR